MFCVIGFLHSSNWNTATCKVYTISRKVDKHPRNYFGKCST